VTAQMAVADNDDVVFHLAGEHTASLLGIVALQSLQNKNGNNDPEQNTLAPERIKIGKRSRMKAKVNGMKKRLAKRKMLPMKKSDGAKSEP